MNDLERPARERDAGHTCRQAVADRIIDEDALAARRGNALRRWCHHHVFGLQIAREVEEQASTREALVASVNPALGGPDTREVRAPVARWYWSREIWCSVRGSRNSGRRVVQPCRVRLQPD